MYLTTKGRDVASFVNRTRQLTTSREPTTAACHTVLATLTDLAEPARLLDLANGTPDPVTRDVLANDVIATTSFLHYCLIGKLTATVRDEARWQTVVARRALVQVGVA